MEFHQPHALWLLLLVPPLAWWYICRTDPALEFADLRILDSPKSKGPLHYRTFPLVLRLLTLVACIAGLARPRWPDESTRIPAQSTAIQIVLDVSGSMAEEDVLYAGKKVGRLEVAKEMVRQFVQGDGEKLSGRSEDLIGLVTFAAQVEDSCPPTLSHPVLLRLVERAQPKRQMLDNTTNIGDALAKAIELLSRAEPQSKCIILLSDGEHNVPPEVIPGALKPRQAAQLARPLGIRVHTIFFSGSSSANSLERASETLRDVATMTGGQAYQASDAAMLAKIYGEINALERQTVLSHDYYHYVELYPYCTLVACITLCVLVTGEEGLWRKLP